MKEVNFVPVLNADVVRQSEPIKIITNKIRGSKISLCTKVDDGFIFNFMENKEQLGDFLDMEVDTTDNTLIMHFIKKEEVNE